MVKEKIKLCPECQAKFRKATTDRVNNRKELGLPIGRPKQIDYDAIRRYAEVNPRARQKDIAEALSVSISTVCRALKGVDRKRLRTL